MNWKEIDKIEHIYSGLKIKDNFISYFDKNKQFIIRDIDTLTIKHKLDFGNSYIYHYVNGNIYFSKNNVLTRLNIEKFNIEDLYVSEQQYIEPLDDNYFISSSYSRKAKTFITELVSKGNGPLWKIEDKIGFRTYIYPHLFFLNREETSIINIDFNSGDNRWLIEFNQKITGNLHLHDNTLIIPTKGKRLYGIDAESGEQLWELEGTHPSYVKHPQTGLLYAHGSNVYQVVDPEKGEIIFEKDFTEENKQYGVLPAPSGYICGDGIYFTSNTGGSKFGKLNIQTHSLEFVQKLDVEEGLTAQHPVYHQGRIYILDNTGTLHVYEQDE